MRLPSLPSGGQVRLGSRRSSSTVALDIGPDAVVVVQSSGTERARLRRAIVHPLPVGLVVDGEIVNAEELAAELRSCFNEHKLPRDVRVGLAHPRLMVRMVELPATLDGQDLDGAVRHLAVDLLPVALDQLVVDYRRVGRSGDQQRVLMAAARVDGLERLTSALDKAGLRCQRVQLSGLALLAALDRPKIDGEAILYVSAGALTNVVITEDDEPLLVRAVSAGSESIAAGLAERAGISHEAARMHIATLGVGSAPPHGSPKPISDELEAAVTMQVREGLRRIVAEVQSSRGFYAARADAKPIGAVVLTGAMTTWPGVTEALRDELHLPVLAAGRESWPELGTVKLAPERLDVAVGLALGADNERPDLRPGRAVRKHVHALPPRVAPVACAMTAVLAAAVVYLVSISNQVNSGRERLGQISGELATAEQQAAALKPYADFAAATISRRDAVTTVAKTRFKWDRTLEELARVAPGDVWLTSATGTLSPTTQLKAGGDGGTGGLRGAIASPALELSGCAATERDVPAYMDRLHAMTGVTEVGFSRAERLEKTAGSGASAGGGGAAASGGGDCRGNDTKASKFAIVTYFKASPELQAAQAVDPVTGAPAAAAPSGSAPVSPTPGAGTTAPSNQTAAATTGVKP